MTNTLNRVPSFCRGTQARVDLTKKLPGNHQAKETKVSSQTYRTICDTERLMKHTKKFLVLGAANSQTSLAATHNTSTPDFPDAHKALTVSRQQVDVVHKNAARAKVDLALRTKSGNCSEQAAIFIALAAATKFNQRVATYQVLNPLYEGQHDKVNKKYIDHSINVIGDPKHKDTLIAADTWPDFPFAELLKDSIWQVELDKPKKVYTPGDTPVMTLEEMENAFNQGFSPEEIDKIYFDDSFADPADSCADDRKEFLAGEHPIYLQLHSSKNLGNVYVDEANHTNKLEKQVDSDTFNARVAPLQGQQAKSPVLPYSINIV